MTPGGLVAIGDSIVNGHGEPVLRVQCQSFALWLAQASDWSFQSYARGGASSTEIVSEQLPRVTRSYEVGIFNMGANDVIRGDLATLSRNARDASERLREQCQRVVMLNMPSTVGPRAVEANHLLTEAVAGSGVLLLDISDLAGPRHVAADRVHPTALGQLEIADRAARLLGVGTLPSSLTLGTPQGRLPLGYRLGRVKGTARRLARQALRR